MPRRRDPVSGQVDPDTPDSPTPDPDPDLPAVQTDDPEPPKPPKEPPTPPEVEGGVDLQAKVDELTSQVSQLAEVVAGGAAATGTSVEEAVAAALASKEHDAEHARLATDRPPTRERSALARMFLGDRRG